MAIKYFGKIGVVPSAGTLAERGRKVGQQLGLIRHRDWAGRIGRTGSSLDWWRLAFRFLVIEVFLICYNMDSSSIMIRVCGSTPWEQTVKIA
jgi:hypothetical protein